MYIRPSAEPGEVIVRERKGAGVDIIGFECNPTCGAPTHAPAWAGLHRWKSGACRDERDQRQV